MTPHQLAEITHQANKILCEQQGDWSQPDWADAPDWQRKSSIGGVLFHLENSDATPENSHENWLKEKAEDGWKYGPVKNPATKEHPCFVPYDQLPPNQQMKDHLFHAIVHSLGKFVER